MNQYRCGDCYGRVCWLATNKLEAPRFCPYCGQENADWEFAGDGASDDNQWVFHDIEEFRDFAIHNGEEAPEEILELVWRTLPVNNVYANLAWQAMSNLVDGSYFGGDSTMLRFEFNEKIKKIPKYDLCHIVVRNGFAAGLVVRESLRLGEKK